MNKKIKTMLGVIIAIAVIFTVLFLYVISQGQDDTNKFIGAWKANIDTNEMIYTFSDYAAGKNTVVYGFDENRSLIYNAGGTYEIKSGKLCVTPYPANGDSPVYFDYKFSNNSNTLTLSSNDGFGVNITFDKLQSFNLSEYLNLPEPQSGVQFTPMWWRYESPYAKLDFRLSNMTQPSWIQLTPEDLDELNITVQYNDVNYPYVLEYNFTAGVEQYDLQADIGENASGRVVFTVSYVYGEFSGTEQQILDI